MADLIGQRFVLAVAQLPFETTSEGNVRNLFGTLVPVVSLKGDIADPEDFANSGLVWWLVRPVARNLATPGRLIKGTLEEAVRYESGNPHSMFYQVHKDSVAPVEASDLVEVLTIDDDSVEQIHQRVAPRSVAQLNRPVTGTVLVRWRNKVVGPFKATSSGEGVIYDIALATHRTDQSVTVLADSDFRALAADALLRHSVDVTLEPQNRGRASSVMRCAYELLLGPGAQRFNSHEHSRQRLETDADVVRRIARRILPKRERQEAAAWLSKLDDAVRVRPDEVLPDDRRVLEALKQQTTSAQSAVDELARALLQTGLLEGALKDALKEAQTTYVDDNVERLSAEINQRVVEEQKRLEGLRADVAGLTEQIDSQKREAREALQLELAATRRAFDDTLATEREGFQRERERQEQVHDQIQEAVQHLNTARGEVLGSVLATLSLLRESPSPAAAPAPPLKETAQKDPIELPTPSFVTSPVGPGEPGESAFFERFVAHVERRGFRYRRLDLVRFHLSMKCGDVTILAGPSGIGKSSLPRLYNEALAGSSADARRRYLEVAVSPSWLDMRDLLGYVNTLDRRFQPSESGLFVHLANVQREFEARGNEAGVNIVSLDEMNLSQVEHYFSGFLQAVERPLGERFVACFASETVESTDPLRQWARLNLPPSLRFVGTVNMDETTKQLSLRLLDRANFIRLVPQPVSGGQADDDGASIVEGPAVLLKNYRSWIRHPALPPSVGELMDTVRRQLSVIGAPVSPRRQRALATFVASAPPELCTSEEALDVQIAQRLLPQLRGTVLEDAQDGLRNLLQVFETREESYPETLRTLRDLVTQVEDDALFAEN